MSAWITELNGWGTSWMTWAAASVVQSSLLIVLVLILTRVLRRRVNPVVLQGLWLLVLVKLLLPPSLSLPTGVGYWVPRKEASGDRGEVTWTMGNRSRTGDVSMYDLFTSEAVPARSSEESPKGWALLDPTGGLALLAGLGSVFVLVGVLRAWARLRTQIRRAEVADESWQAAARECVGRLGLRRVPEVRVTSWLSSPAVCGLRRGVILIPKALVADLGPEARMDVLLHEMAHIRRGDLWVGTLEVLLLVTYWWHPLVWLARARWQELREEIADAMVIAEGRREAGAYAETLLRVAKAAVHRPVLALGLMGILESRSALKARVERMLREEGIHAPRMGWKAGLALMAFGFLVLPMGEGARRSVAAEVPGYVGETHGTKVAYEFDPEFVRYFGQTGVDTVKAAMRTMETNESLRVMTLAYPTQAAIQYGTPEDLADAELLRRLRGGSRGPLAIEREARRSVPLHGGISGANRGERSAGITLSDPGDDVRWPVMTGSSAELWSGGDAASFFTNGQRTDFYSVEKRGGPGRAEGVGGSANANRSAADPAALMSTEARGSADVGADPVGSTGQGKGVPEGEGSKDVLPSRADEGRKAEAPPVDGVQPPQLLTRSYRTNLGVLIAELESVTGRRFPDRADGWTEGLVEVLKAAGVTFEPPRMLQVDIRRGLILVRNDAAALEKVDALLDALTALPPMVTIESRFVKVADPRLDFLNALVQPDAPMLTPSQFRGIWGTVEALVPAKDRGPQPRITTLTGRDASIQVGIPRETDSTKEPVEGGPEDGFGFRLEAVPWVSKDGTNIVMHLRASERMAVGGIQGATAEGRVVERSKSAEPRMRSGETLVLKLEDLSGSAKAKDGAAGVATYVFVTGTITDPAGNAIGVAAE